MAVISKTNMTNLATLVGDSYDAILSAYGDYDTIGSAVYLMGKAKTFVRGGAEAINGVRQQDVGAGGTTLDLIPTTATDTLTIRRGRFYLDGVEQNLQSNRTFDFGALLPMDWWAGIGHPDAADKAALEGMGTTDMRAKALVYASNETISGHPEMDSGEVFSTTSATTRLNGTNIGLAAPFTTTAATYLDKVQLYISTNTSGSAPNTGLKLYIVPNDAGQAPDEPDMTLATIVATSLKVNDLAASGGWVDFIFDSEVSLSGTTSYWVVLASDTPDDGSASNLSASIFYDWHYDTATTGNKAADNTTNFMASTDLTTTWAASNTKLPAIRFVEYLKVVYTPPMALAESGLVAALTNAVGVKENLAIVEPDVSHVKIALCDLLSVAADPSSGMVTATFGTASATKSIMTDVREVVGYQGLEDDDQMSVIFPAINTTENEIVAIAGEAAASPVALDFAPLCTGLSSHVTTLVSGSTFKTYWRTNEAYLSRSFRKIWEFNQNEELSARYGTFTFDAGGPTAFSSPIDPRWVADTTYCADLSTGANLEIHLPLGQGAITSTTTAYVFGITTSFTTLNARSAAGAGFLSVDDPSIFDTSASPARVYLWVEKWGGTNGELLKVTTISGNMLTLAAEAGYVGATALYTHEIGDRVWLVDRMEQAVSTTVGTEGANIALTTNFTGSKFVGVAYVQPKGVSGTATDVIEIRNS